MPREKKSFQTLHSVDYDIVGNAFRAWKNDADELVFVLDETIDDFKPNVLLVLNARDDRKWDDILVNDYGINLEDVRPRVDNKYQKLDIEYTGLDVYSQLIDEYERDADVSATIADLIDFRDTAARRSAMARLATANDIIAAAEDTILRTERSKAGLRDRRRNLRNRLANQKEDIGREPTKQSAAKILKTESQIDAVGEKLVRADKRIENARHRIAVATEDANAARDLLSRRREVQVVVTEPVKEQIVVPARKKAPSIKIKVSESEKEADAEKSEESDMPYFPVPDYEYQSQPRDEKMSDLEEVKPLLDQDPEILDDEIAFKPVAFDDIKPRVDENNPDKKKKEYVETEADAENAENVARPLDFSSTDSVSQETSYEEKIEETETVEETPVIDTIKTVEETPVIETIKTVEETPVIETIKTVEEPKVADIDTTGRTANTQYDNATPIRPVAPVAPVANNYTRPISPITGNTPVRPVGADNKRSNFAYYLLLILLIALSVFTLWLYQKKNGGTVPFLNASTDRMIEQQDENTVDNNLVGFEDAETEKTTLPEPFVQTEVIIQPEPEPEPDIPVVVENEPIKIEYPNENILRAAEPDARVIETEEDVLARKVAYDVAREDKPVYVPEPAPRVTNLTAPDVIFDDDVISVPVVPADYSDEGVYYQDDSAYYDNQDAYYDESVAYQEYNQTGGFVVQEQPREPETTRHLNVYDGGQYSVGYTETTY